MAAVPGHGDFYQSLKTRIHTKLIEKLDLSKIETMDRDRVKEEIGVIVEDLLDAEGVPLNRVEREQIVVEVQNETFGLGPLEPLLQDPEISDILVNTHKEVYVERFGKLEMTPVVFRDDAHLLKIIDRIVSSVGRRVDEFSPMVDARLADGSRVNAIIPPLAIDGPILSIRRFGVNPLKTNDLLARHSLTPPMMDFLRAAVKAKINMVISGGTGSGKTTLLNVLSAFIPAGERIVTIEDSAELQLQQPHVVRLETRPANIEQKGLIAQRDLVRNSLRMRPDRIIVGEVRGAEVLDMLQAMNTGHEGSLTTIHANDTRECLTRLESMMLMSGVNIPEKAMRDMIVQAIDLIVQVARLSDGTRKVIRITEVVSIEGGTITMQDIYTFERKGMDEQGAITGEFKPTGIRPMCAERILASGIELPDRF
ncbi:MAG: CpaF family protein [Deltaproteobacteria bacterium]|nr:CpaF family protein [Deltaproteobacteria bacterium]